MPLLSVTSRRTVNSMLTTRYIFTCFLFKINPTRIFPSRFPTKRFHEFFIFPFSISPPPHLRKDVGYLTGCNDCFCNRGLEKMFKQSANSHCSRMLQMPHSETSYRFRCCGREICCHVSEQELHPVESVYRLQIDNEYPRKRIHH